MSPSVAALSVAEAEARVPELAEILLDCVEGGASVSFMSPFTMAEAERFWRGVAEGVADGSVVLLAALGRGRAVGTVHLRLATPPNQPHRADVAKLLVHRAARGRGVAAALMDRLEADARAHGRTLLTLDTMTNSAAERLYERLGWTRVGVIDGYALFPDGRLGATTIFFKRLACCRASAGRRDGRPSNKWKKISPRQASMPPSSAGRGRCLRAPRRARPRAARPRPARAGR